MSNELTERNRLIQQLLAWYPYPLSVWEGKSTGQLWAIYFRGQPKAKQQKEEEDEYEYIPRLGDPDYKPKRCTVDGVDYILNDGGEYVELID